MPDVVMLRKQNGQEYQNIRADVQPDVIFIDDGKIPLEEGDHIVRELSNGLDETYLVLDRGFWSGGGRLGDHYQAKVRKVTAITADTPPVVYNVSGPNARVNIHSYDASTNVVDVSPERLFEQIREAVAKGVQAPDRKAEILSAVGEVEAAGDSKARLKAYQRLIAIAADHMTLLGPFIPGLTQLLR